MRIFKYPLEITDVQRITLNGNRARPLSAGYQNGQLMMWAETYPDEPPVVCRVYVIGTGNPTPDLIRCRFLQTVQDPNRPLVWHIYYRSE